MVIHWVTDHVGRNNIPILDSCERRLMILSCNIKLNISTGRKERLKFSIKVLRCS